MGDLDKSQLCDSAGADTQLYTSTHPEHFPNAAWCLWNAPFILGFSAYFQQQMHVCTCLLSLSVPITASKDLVLCKCAVCVLQQLLMTAMAKGYHLLPHMQQHICVEMFFSLLHFAHFFQRWATFTEVSYFNLFLPNKSYSGQAHTNHAAQISDYYMQPTTWGWRQQISKCTSRQRTTRKLKYKLLRPCDVMWNWPNELIWHLTGSWRGNVVLPKNWHKLPGRKLSVF